MGGGNSPLDKNRTENRVKDVGNRYPEYLEPYQIAFIEDVIGKTMQQHGYEVNTKGAPTWKTIALHANYSAKPVTAGLRTACGSLRRTYHTVIKERRRQSTDDLFDY
jgi:hypothetical protein